MLTMDIFNNDAFSQRTMLEAYEHIPYLPQTVRELGIFTPEPIRTTVAQIEKRDGVLGVIQTSQRGDGGTQRTTEKRKMINLETYRIVKEDVIQASELLNMRPFGQTDAVQQVKDEITRRLLGPTGIVRDIEYTFENMMLSAAQGTLVDADDTVLVDYFTEFDVSQDSEIDFDLDNASPAPGALAAKCQQVQNQTRRAAGGSFLGSSYVLGLCGENFWRDLNSHPEVIERRKAMTMGGMPEGVRGLFGDDETVRFGKVIFVLYWGSDDGAVAVGTDKVKFVPVGVPGLFRHVMAPGESFAHLNAPGQAVYVEILPDRERERYVKIVASSYPLMLCTRPKMLQRGKRT